MMMGIIKKVTQRLRLPVGIEKEDLYSYGWMGYDKALKTYGDNSEMTFADYAEWKVKYAIIDGLRKENPLARGNIELQKAKDRLTLSGQSITDDALCKDMGVGKKRLSTMNIKFVELKDTEPFYNLGFKQMDARILLSFGFSGLSSRELSIVWMHFYRGDTLAEIGKSMCLTESGVSRIKKAALAKMKKTMTYDEV
mgnify:CR=1 FL=1|tara:strand:- start:2758 stop:3345 length:588 start_codon:yes stop_codon:yes gene_type:complete